MEISGAAQELVMVVFVPKGPILSSDPLRRFPLTSVSLSVLGFYTVLLGKVSNGRCPERAELVGQM